ncbi:TRAP transporter large permease subunit [Pseudomonas thivervalensis]|uniref:TRAP transporter large permease subunit n=1 Tax=Pseudomonas thivervalensis TaxID=86265 RepID=UPI003D99BFD3
MALGVLVGVLMAALLIGAPIAYALILCGVALMWLLGLFDGQIIAQNIINSAGSFPLRAIPLFIIAGEVMNSGGLSKRIINLTISLVGHLRGGLGYVTIFAGVLLSSLSGSALADAASLTALLLPMMVIAGYNRNRSGGLIASVSVLGSIIPPSIGFVVLGVASGLSITKLLLAGIAPGLMIATALVITWWLVSRRDNGIELSPKASGKERLKALADSTWALLLPVIIVVGLRFGIVTPTEAGAVASVYALLVSSLIYRELSLKSLSELLLRAGKTTAAVMFLVAAASIPAWMITIADIPEQIIDLIQPLMDNPKLLIVVLMLLILLILLISMVMDLTPTILLLAPILVPVVTAANIDPIYFGVLFMINCSSGLITSPVGTVLNVVCGIGNMRYEALLKGTVPFLIAETIVLFLLVIFPDLVTVPARWFAH